MYVMGIWAFWGLLEVYKPEQGMAAWWQHFTHSFQDVWLYGPGLFLFVLEPLLLIFGAIIAQNFCKLKPKTIWSAPALILVAYMFFWMQPWLWWLATGEEWSPAVGYITTMPFLVGGGTVLAVRRGFKADWRGAFRFALDMLGTNYITCLVALFFMPNID